MNTVIPSEGGCIFMSVRPVDGNCRKGTTVTVCAGKAGYAHAKFMLPGLNPILLYTPGWHPCSCRFLALARYGIQPCVHMHAFLLKMRKV